MKQYLGFLLMCSIVVAALVADHFIEKPVGSQPASTPDISSQPQQTPKQSKPSVSTAELMPVILDDKASFATRLKAVRQLPSNLNSEQQAELLALIKTKEVDESLRNDALIALEKQRTKLRTLGADLVSMWNDDTNSDKWLDFTLQHMAPVHSFSDNRSELEQVLLETAKKKHTKKDNFPGTALIALQNLAKTHPHIAKEVKQLTANTVADGRSGKAEQEKALVALQVATDAGDKFALQRARALAVDTTVITRLRLASVATIGTMGGRDDLMLLKNLTRDKDNRVSRVAVHQLEVLKKKSQRITAEVKNPTPGPVANREPAKVKKAKSPVAQKTAAADSDKLALHKARALAEDASADTDLRLTAMTTIGTSGGRDDLMRLKRLTQDKNQRVSSAAAEQLKALKKKTLSIATAE